MNFLKRSSIIIISSTFILIVSLFETSAQTEQNDLVISQSFPSVSKRRAQVRDSIKNAKLKNKNELSNEDVSPEINKEEITGNKIKNKNIVNDKPEPASKSSAEKRSQSVPSSDVPKVSAAKKTFSSNVELPIPDSIIVEDLSVRQTEIRDVLTGLASQHGINLLLDKDVSGPISINLTKMPLKNVIILIAEENGYQLSVQHGAIKVSRPPEPKPEPPPEPSFLIEYKDGKLTVDIQGISIERVVRRLVDATGKTIVLERGTTGEINSYYKDVEFVKALKLIVETNGFRMKDREGIITIYKESWVSSKSGGSSGDDKSRSRTRVYVKNDYVIMEVNDVPLQKIVSSIINQAGLSSIFYGQITGNVTARLDSVPIIDALQYLFRGTDFTFWLNKGILFIGSKEMKAITNSKLIVLESMKADEIMDLIPPELIKGMKVKLVPSQNAIMVMGTFEAISMLEDYISKVDLPVAQILIEALVVDFDMDKIRNYGVNLFLGSARAARGQETLYPSFDMTLNNKDTEKLFSGIPGLRDILSLPRNFVAKIEALEREKVLKIRSRPQIATLNGKTASITVGQTQYFLLKSETDFNQTQTVTTRTQERFEKIQADVTLTVTPFVTGKGEITVEIIPDFSEPEGTFSSNMPPTINRRHLKSTVRLREGETIVLGGLVKESLNADHAQFPVLGSIPILGWFFKNRSSTKSRTQLMIFVTPHIYYGSDANVDPDKLIKELK
jgi:type II secretory pathway component GspD/PulD (secretin)